MWGLYLSGQIGRKAMFMWSAVGSFVMILIYMFAPLDNFLLLRMGFPLGIILCIKFPPMGPFMTELAKVFATTAGRDIGAVFPAMIGFLSGHMSLAGVIGVFSSR